MRVEVVEGERERERGGERDQGEFCFFDGSMRGGGAPQRATQICISRACRLDILNFNCIFYDLRAKVLIFLWPPGKRANPQMAAQNTPTPSTTPRKPQAASSEQRAA